MTVTILQGDALTVLKGMDAESVDCVVTSPPYWGLRDYGVDGQMGLEPTLGEHIEAMVEVFAEVHRVLKPTGTCWVNYGDCYATQKNGRPAAEVKFLGKDNRTFRDKPFSTTGPVLAKSAADANRQGKTGKAHHKSSSHGTRVVAGGTLKARDLCLMPHRFAIAMQEFGWWVRSDITWGKPNAMPDSSGRYRPSTASERIFLFHKETPYYNADAVRMPPAGDGDKKPVHGWANHENYKGQDPRNPKREKTVSSKKTDKQRGHSRRHAGFNDRWDAMTKAEQQANGRLLRNYEPDLTPICGQEVWQIPTVSFSEAHFATFPPALVMPCIMAGCPPDGIVMDPFGGAGTTGLVADRLGRDCTLIELNPEYIEIARQRIKGDCPMFVEVA